MHTISITNLTYDDMRSSFIMPKDEEIHFDLSQLKFARPEGIVLFALLLRGLQLKEGRKIKVSLPDFTMGDYCPLSYLWRIHFFDKLHDSTVYNDEDKLKLEQLKNHREHQSTQFTKIIDNLKTATILK